MSFRDAKDLFFCADCKIIHDHKTHSLESRFVNQQLTKWFKLKECKVRLNRIKTRWSENEVRSMTTPMDSKLNKDHSSKK